MRFALFAPCLIACSTGTLLAQVGPAIVSVSPVVVRQNVEAGQSFVGHVHPIRRSVIGSAVDGRVVEFKVNAGDYVTAKQPLAQLLTKQLEIQIAGAEADLKLKTSELQELQNGARPEEKREANAKMAAAQAAYDYVQLKLQRTKALFERNAVSEDELQDDVSKALAAAQMYEAAKAAHDLVIAGPRAEKIAQAQARELIAQEEVNRLKDLLVKHTITTPFEGYVVAEHTEVGQWIKSGELVAEVEELTEVEVEAQVLENYLDFVKLGSNARIEIPALPGELFVGQVSAVVPRGDPRSRNFPVMVRLKNKFDSSNHPLVKSGMFARVWFPVERRESVLLIPQDAVVMGGPVPIVYAAVRDAPGAATAKAKLIPVTLGSAFDDYFEASGPLEPGMELVIEGNERLRPEQPVRIVAASREAPASAARPSGAATQVPAAGNRPQ